MVHNISCYVVLLLTVYFETYGCQMNVNDTEVAWAILQKNGFVKTDDIYNVTTLFFV